MTIGIIGYGRFGRLLAALLEEVEPQLIYDINPSSIPKSKRVKTISGLQGCETIFIAVPIGEAFQSTCEQLAKFKTSNQTTTIIDVCSIKKYSSDIMLATLGKHFNLIATHPLFGPDSFDLVEKKMVICNLNQAKSYHKWKQIFENLNLDLIEMDSDDHDRLMARSLLISQTVGRVLEKYGFDPQPTDTLGVKRLYKVMNQAINDSDQLYHDMIQYNPYAKAAIKEFLDAINQVIKT